MRPEPIEFAAVGALRAKCQSRFSQSPRDFVKRASEQTASAVLDEAFAEYSRIDAGTSVSEQPAASYSTPTASLVAPRGSNDRRALTRELVADIAAQLEALDGQRRQLARLLESVEIGAVTD